MDDITRAGMQFVPQDIKKSFPEAANLMNAALNFIRNIELILKQYQHLSKEISFFSKPLNDLGQILLHNKAALQQIITQQYHFEQQLNNFLGRSINFAWVNVRNGQVLFADQATAQKIYAKAGTQSKKRNSATTGKVYESAVRKEASTLPNFVEQQFKTLVQTRLAEHQSLLVEVLNRWNNNHRNDNPWVKAGHGDTVYWQHPPVSDDGFNHPIYSWSGIINRGHISQGYINFIFNSIENFGTGESDIGNFILRYGGEKNSNPGIQKGDIIVQNTDGKVQIAVKSSSKFDTASIGPYLSVAFQIISFYDSLESLTIDSVETILNKTSRYSESVTQAGREAAKQVIEDIARSTGAQVF